MLGGSSEPRSEEPLLGPRGDGDKDTKKVISGSDTGSDASPGQLWERESLQCRWGASGCWRAAFGRNL